MKALVFGATGGTGRLVVEQSLAAGHETSVFVHRDRKGVAARLPGSVEVFHGDVRNPAEVSGAVVRQDAVLVALGVIPGRTRRILSTGTTNIVQAMRKGGATRLIVETGAGLAGDTVAVPLPWRVMSRVPPLRGMFADKRRQEEAVMESGLDWTLVRPANLTDGPATTDYLRAEEMELDASSSISRADVATFMVGQLTSDDFIRKSVLLRQPG